MKIDFSKLVLLAAIPVSLVALSSVGVDTQFGQGLKSKQLTLFRVTPYEVARGGYITVEGSGFSKTSNKLYFNGSFETKATSSDGTTLKVMVPQDLSEGQYTLRLSNSLGNSDSKGPVYIKVTSNPISPPQIKSASVTGDNVTLVGSNFTSSNTIFSTFGNSSPISSDGTTLTFKVNDLSYYSKIKNSKKFNANYKTTLLIYVLNEHGMSVEPYKLEMVI